MKNLKFYVFMLLCGLMLIMTGCNQPQEPMPQPSQEQPVAQDREPAQTVPQEKAEEPVNLSIHWGDSIILPGQVFGDITVSGADMVEVWKDNSPLGVFAVRSENPELLSVESTMSRIQLKKLQSFEGETPGFTITYSGYDYTFYCNDDTWAEKPDVSTPDVSAPDAPLEPELPAKPAVPATPSTAEEKLVAYLTTPQYTKEQIDQWVAEGLTVEQWAEKIKVPADAIQMLNALNYRDVEHNDNVTFYDSIGTEWGSAWNAQTVFDHRSGNCGGTSNIINALFVGDFDEQGYVEFNSANGGHIFNYFVSDSTYVFCDFVGIPGPYSLGGERVCPPDAPWFVVYTASSPKEFGDWYRNEGFFAKEFADPNQEAYLYQLFMYPCTGVKHPKGRDNHSEQTKFNNPVWDILPEQYKDDYIILYEREGHPLRFCHIPDRKTWPSEIR